MLEALVAVASAAVGGFIAHVYYRKAATTVPDWFKPILDRLNLPAKPPSKEQLLQMFQSALESGEARPDVLGNVACPNCGTAASQFSERWYGGSDRGMGHTFVDRTCPRCGWTDSGELT